MSEYTGNLNPDKPAILAYIPAVHSGYLDLIDGFPDIDQIGILGLSVTEELDHLRKDIRRLAPEDAATAIGALTPNKDVVVVEKPALAAFKESGTDVVLPDDDVTRMIIDLALLDDSQIERYPVFLRWNRENSHVNVDVEYDREADISEIPANVIEELVSKRNRSTDIWRHVSAVLFDNEGIIDSRYNHHLPTDYSPFIDGDVRAQSQRGEGIDNYTSEHGEAALIAEAASRGESTKGSFMIVTDFPCPQCAKAVAHAQVARLYFVDGYAMGNGLNSLKDAGVEVIKLNTTLPEEDPRSLREYPKKKS